MIIVVTEVNLRIYYKLSKFSEGNVHMLYMLCTHVHMWGVHTSHKHMSTGNSKENENHMVNLFSLSSSVYKYTNAFIFIYFLKISFDIDQF